MKRSLLFALVICLMAFIICGCEDNGDDNDSDDDSGEDDYDDDDDNDDDNDDDDNDDNDDDDDDDDCDPLFPDLLITAHRGATTYAPENTLPSIEKAFELGAFAVEMDVRNTSDGHFVLMHDDTVDRTTNGTGLVSEMTLEEIQELQVNDWIYGNIHGDLKVPTFEQALELIDSLGGHTDLDMKTDQVEGAIQVVVDLGLEDICFVYSGSPDKLERVRSVSTDVRIQPSSSSTEETQALLDRFDPDPEHIELTSDGFYLENINLIKQQGAVVFMDALGVRDAAAQLGLKGPWRDMMEKGVEIIQTDFPGSLADYRDSLCE